MLTLALWAFPNIVLGQPVPAALWWMWSYTLVFGDSGLSQAVQFLRMSDKVQYSIVYSIMVYFYNTASQEASFLSPGSFLHFTVCLWNPTASLFLLTAKNWQAYAEGEQRCVPTRSLIDSVITKKSNRNDKISCKQCNSLRGRGWSQTYLSGQIRCFGADVCRMINRSKSGVYSMLLFVVLPPVDFVTTASCKVQSLHDRGMQNVTTPLLNWMLRQSVLYMYFF